MFKSWGKQQQLVEVYFMQIDIFIAMFVTMYYFEVQNYGDLVGHWFN